MSEINIEETPIVPEEVNLENLRDEKCIPVARGVLEDMVEHLVPENAGVSADYRPITNKILQRTLDADLNISTEVSYIFQLILGIFSGLNATVQKTTLEPIDDIRFGRIAKEILAIVSKANLPMTNVKKEDIETLYSSVKDQLNALFATEKLTKLELKYVIDNIFNSFTAVNNSFNESLAQSTARAEAKLLGIEAMSDLTMKKLEEVLTKE